MRENRAGRMLNAAGPTARRARRPPSSRACRPRLLVLRTSRARSSLSSDSAVNRSGKPGPSPNQIKNRDLPLEASGRGRGRGMRAVTNLPRHSRFGRHLFSSYQLSDTRRAARLACFLIIFRFRACLAARQLGMPPAAPPDARLTGASLHQRGYFTGDGPYPTSRNIGEDASRGRSSRLPV